MEMQLGGLFQTRFDGNRREYSIESSKGWQLLYEAAPERAAWFDWRAFGRAVATVWDLTSTMKGEGLTDYIFKSEMAKALAAARGDFIAAGLALSGRPVTEEFLEKLKRL